MGEKDRVRGIDLGTTNTCVAHVRHRVAKLEAAVRRRVAGGQQCRAIGRPAAFRFDASRGS